MGSSAPLPLIMCHRTIKDLAKALHVVFASSNAPLSLPADHRRTIQTLIQNHQEGFNSDDVGSVNNELKRLWAHSVKGDSHKCGEFVGVLRELSPVLAPAVLWEWWEQSVRPVFQHPGYGDAVVPDARQFAADLLLREGAHQSSAERAELSSRLCRDILDVYVAQMRSLNDGEDMDVPRAAWMAQQIEEIIVAFGRKRPKILFGAVDGFLTAASTRMQALTLLGAFLGRQDQTPHIYLVADTPLVENLLRCLLNDSSTAVLSIALNVLTMLLPHIPGSLGPQLPKLFLIYSRILCWERFAPLGTQDERNAVTDDRGENLVNEQGYDPGDIGMDPTWDKLRPKPGVIEASTPKLMIYFTYLYGLYPLNLMSYIRKPRRYLKEAGFPRADAFDLDANVVSERSDHFRQVHLLHPNFYHMTIEEELSNPKWPRMDPSDVVGECHGLVSDHSVSSSAARPQSKCALPEPPALSPVSAVASSEKNEPHSPIASSPGSFSSHHDAGAGLSDAGPTSRTKDQMSDLKKEALESGDHVKRPAVLIRSPSMEAPRAPTSLDSNVVRDQSPLQNDVGYMQREVQILRNELSFERWHKAQYSAHISHITRKNVQGAMRDAEVLNLINANRALKRQLEHLQRAREAAVKDTELTRKQTKSLESNMTERFKVLKIQQEQWRADANELHRLRLEMPKYRELLVACEARGLTQLHDLQLAKREIESLKDSQATLQRAESRLRAFEHRDLENEEQHAIQVYSPERLMGPASVGVGGFRGDPLADSATRLSPSGHAQHQVHPTAGLLWTRSGK